MAGLTDPMSRQVRRVALVILLTIVPIGSAVLRAPAAAGQEPKTTGGFADGLPEGASLVVLAEHVADVLTTDPLWEGRESRLRLERVSLAPGEGYTAQQERLNPELGDLSPTGLALILVESGSLLVDSGEGGTAYAAGEQAVIAAGAEYDIRNEGAACGTALKLSFHSMFPGGMGTSAEHVTDLPEACEAPAVLLDLLSRPWPPTPARIFIARMTLLPPAATVPGHVHTGPTGLVVESGRWRVGDHLAGHTQNVDVGIVDRLLAPDAAVEIPAGVHHDEMVTTVDATGLGAEPAVALVAGVVAADQPLVVPTDYVSTEFGYRLTWDESWNITGESRSSFAGNAYAWLRLWNGTSTVDVEGIAPFEDTPERCLDEGVAEWTSGPDVADIERLDEPIGPLLAAADPPGAFAQYAYRATGQDRAGAFVVHIECRLLVSRLGVVRITVDIPEAAVAAEVEPLRELLGGLVLPA